MTIGLRRPHNFAAGFALKFVKKWKIFCIFFVENGRLAWDVLTFSRSRVWSLFWKKSHENWSDFSRTDVSPETSSQFCRPTLVVLSIVAFQKTDVWPQTSSHFGAQICATQSKNTIFVTFQKQDVWRESSSQFRALNLRQFFPRSFV